MLTGELFRGENVCITLSTDIYCTNNFLFYFTKYVVTDIYEKLSGLKNL